jgi:hypothetical protein
MKCIGYYIEVLINVKISRQILTNCTKKNFMKTRPVAEDLFDADRQTDGRTDRHNDANCPFSYKKYSIYKLHNSESLSDNCHAGHFSHSYTI